MSEIEGKVLPIVAYGDPVLKQQCKDIEADDPNVQQLIANMFATMENASGVGLAAPQIGKLVRLFIVDASPFADDEDEDLSHLKDFRKVFINAQIIEETGDEWGFEEGCLSIPTVREDVYRNEKVTLNYFDENFKEHTETFDGLPARVIQHEYDHIEGVLFTDHLNPLKRRLLTKKLSNISKGKVDVKYKMKFPALKKR